MKRNELCRDGGTSLYVVLSNGCHRTIRSRHRPFLQPKLFKKCRDETECDGSIVGKVLKNSLMCRKRSRWGRCRDRPCRRAAD